MYESFLYNIVLIGYYFMINFFQRLVSEDIRNLGKEEVDKGSVLLGVEGIQVYRFGFL